MRRVSRRSCSRGSLGARFPWYGSDDPGSAARSYESSHGRRLWEDEVRRHGYTVLSLREAAETDAGYQEWLAWQERRARVTAQGSRV